MNASSLKQAYERMPRGIKYALAPIFIRTVVYNREFKKTWQTLDAIQTMSSDERASRQLATLRDTLVYAYDNVPFYKERFDASGFDPRALREACDIQSLPLLEKSEAISAKDSIYSTEQGLGYYETFTGGSSGQTLRVLLDTASIYRERAFVCHYLSSLGYDPLRTRTVALWGHNKGADYYYSPLKNEIVISPFRLLDDTKTEMVCRDIKRFGADFLMGYPSAISQLAKRVRSRGIDLQFEHIVYYAENYSEEDKALAADTFGCKVDSYYGHTERAVFAELVDGACVFNDAYGYTELIPTGEPNEYRVACTGFISRKMPLIRYATDDHIIVGEDGKQHLVGHKRSDTYLVAKNGNRVFKGAMTLHVPELSAIERYQYYQNEPGRATLRLMAIRELSDSEMRHLEEYLRRRTEGLLDIEVEYVEEIELTARGKERWAVCDIAHSTER